MVLGIKNDYMILRCFSEINSFCSHENDPVPNERFVFQNAIQFLITPFFFVVVVQGKEMVCIKNIERKCCLTYMKAIECISYNTLVCLKKKCCVFLPVAYSVKN